MKTIDEKEKKFEEVLNELKNLEISNPNQLEELEIIKNQKSSAYSQKPLLVLTRMVKFIRK